MRRALKIVAITAALLAVVYCGVVWVAAPAKAWSWGCEDVTTNCHQCKNCVWADYDACLLRVEADPSIGAANLCAYRRDLALSSCRSRFGWWDCFGTE